MKLGLLKDIKVGENRVILTPSEVASYVDKGHTVLVAKDAGAAAKFSNEEYIDAGAIISTNEEIYDQCELIVKVKEIEPSEFGMLKEGQIIFTCIHPAAHDLEVNALLKSKVISFAAEDTHRYGSPNCEAAGKAGAFFGLHSLMTISGGKGKFVSGLGAAPGVNALVLGCGVVGKGAISVLQGMGANVTVAATNIGHLRDLSSKYHGKINTIISNKYNIKKIMPHTDLLINCVRWDKSRTDFLIDRDMVASMEEGSVIVDISNDLGVIETFRETTHENPTYIEEGVVHYCVSNIPSAIAQTASISYAASVYNNIANILDYGVKEACAMDGYLRRGMVTYKGYLTHEETSQVQDRPWIQPEVVLGLDKAKKIDKAPNNTVAHSENFYKEINL